VTDSDYLREFGVPVGDVLSNARAEFEKFSDTIDDLKAAGKETAPNPSEAQKESGNYKKGRFQWKGLTLVIETAKGQYRRGVSKDGTAWSTLMKSSYGYIREYRSEADGDHIDFFMSAEHPDSELVFVVDQMKESGRFDEHKIMLGWIDLESATKGYMENYQKGWTGLGAITPTTLPQFKEWLENGDTKKPYARAARNDKVAGVHDLAGNEDQMLLFDGHQLQGLRREGSSGVPKVAGELHGVHGGHGTVPAGPDAGATQREERVLPGKLPVGNAVGAGQEQVDEPVTDARRSHNDAGRVDAGDRAESDHNPPAHHEGMVRTESTNNTSPLNDFEARNEAARIEAQKSNMGHIRDGYIPCGGCHRRYYIMPDDEKCPDCGAEMRTRLRSIKH